MLKFLLVPVNLIFIAFISGFFTSDFKITQKAPERIDSLSSCTIELTIEKGDIKGFAKLQSVFPSGVTVEEVETQGATFTFAQRKMKLIWMNLPDQESFTVKYKLKVEDPETVEVPIGGTFSYLDNNNRMTYDITNHILKVGPSKEQLKEQTKPQVYVYREVEAKGNDKYAVRLKVLSKNLTGFAKIEDIVPYDAKASQVEAKESVFSQVDNKVKFVWMSMPEADTFEVVYNLDLSGALSQDIEEVSGKFSYLYDNSTQKLTIRSEAPDDANTEKPDEEVTPEIPDEEEDQTAELTEEQDTAVEPEPEKSEKITEIERVSEEKIDEADDDDLDTRKYFADGYTDDDEQDEPNEPSPDEEETKTKSVTKQQKRKDQGVNYRVQLLAGHNSVEAPYFEKNYDFTDQFFVENHDGWIKYTTGDFGIYNDARDGREDIRNNYEFPGPFVVAYNDGLRITVQEALMITNQKWIK